MFPSPVARTFNRTSLELKLVNGRCLSLVNALLIAPVWNWNCQCAGDVSLNLGSFNRTSLELKPSSMSCFLKSQSALLIAPVWNWNFHFDGVDLRDVPPFNRTSLELKLDKIREELGLFTRTFNRTSLELKRAVSVHHRWTECQLLIAPVWNWNSHDTVDDIPQRVNF